MADMMDDEDVVMDEVPGPAERLDISFLYMGQGDCILLSCPDGKRILVDCGSAGNWPFHAAAHMALRGDRGVRTSMKLHALILTHPDLDHYNQVHSMLGGRTFSQDHLVGGTRVVAAGTRTDTIPVDTVYFSYKWDGSSGPLVYHNENGTNLALYFRHSVQAMKQVFLRGRSGDGVRVWKTPFRDPQTKLEPIQDDRVLVASGTTARGKAWSVSIIAGNVARADDDPSDSDGKNASSLVTLVQFGNQRALLTGDATFSTERFLIAARARQIGGVYLAQAPHHGSALTSSSPDFVEKVAPTAVAVSVQYWETKHRLPDRPAVKRWLRKVRQVTDTEVLDSWERVAYFRKGRQNDVHEMLEAWRTSGVAFSTAGRTYYRDDAQTVANDYVVLWPSTGYRLFRQSITADLRTTGSHGWRDPLVYTLTGT
ncbi:MAG TPA: MBL fold metallo-hydrolase [Longimicrobium sp.]|nr:MBL fold metallo-hydrolase [Longimicrobium sp.]